MQLPRPNGGEQLCGKQIVLQKHTWVKLLKLCKETCAKCGDLNILIDNATRIECKNCQHVIVWEEIIVA